jgi:hypothetical protein
MHSLPVNFTISTPSCVLVSISKVPSPRPLAPEDTWARSLTPPNPFVKVRAHVRESSLKKQGTRPAGRSPRGYRRRAEICRAKSRNPFWICLRSLPFCSQSRRWRNERGGLPDSLLNFFPKRPSACTPSPAMLAHPFGFREPLSVKPLCTARLSL